MKDMKAKKKNQENKRLYFLKSVLPFIEYNQQVRTFGNFNQVSKIKPNCGHSHYSFLRHNAMRSY